MRLEGGKRLESIEIVRVWASGKELTAKSIGAGWCDPGNVKGRKDEKKLNSWPGRDSPRTLIRQRDEPCSKQAGCSFALVMADKMSAAASTDGAAETPPTMSAAASACRGKSQGAGGVDEGRGI